MPQLMAAFGICSGYFTCYGSIHISSSLSWRTPFIIQAILAIILAVSCVYMPTSPRWLQLNNRSEEARRSIQRLDISLVEAEKDILRARPVRHEGPSGVTGFFMMFKKEYRGRTMLAFFILGMLQLCGIDGVLYVRTPSSHSHLLIVLKVRTHPLYPSRSSCRYSLLPSVRRIGHCHARRLHSSFPLRRQMGPPQLHHHRWRAA